jgi:putative oxidoreductase
LRISGSVIVFLTLEIVLGGLFFYAGVQKVLHPYEFAEAVLAYRLLPESLVGLTAAGLPWVEIVAGLCLIIRLKPRSCLLILAALVAGFLVVILITLARGLKIDCGCGLFFQRQVGLGAVLEDVVLLLWAAGLYWWERARPGKGERLPVAEVTS